MLVKAGNIALTRGHSRGDDESNVVTMEIAGDTAGLATSSGDGRSDRSDERRATRRLALGYWAAVFISSSILWGIAGTDPIESAPGKVVWLSIGALLAFLLTTLLSKALHLPLWLQAASAFLLSMAAAPLYALVDYLIYTVCIYPQTAPFDQSSFAHVLIYGMSLFFGWCCLFLALRYSFALREGERRMAALREQALSAQMRALAYQVSPHFLFNTLNSMAGLIEEGANDSARSMVMRLSSFLRHTLAIDPTHDLALEEEIALQADYLAVESARFSDRMHVVMRVDDDVKGARVPPLILQPILENAVKYGIGATRGMVGLVLTASRNGAMVVVQVENDAPQEREDNLPNGMGIGLRNVADRIAARFPGQASLKSGYVTPGTFAVKLTFPLEFS